MKEIGRPLEEYPEELVMAGVMIDAIEAHRDAWENAKVLHRDISAGNILIYYDEDDDPDSGEEVMPRGILNDWDLCKYKEDLNSGATQRGRSVSQLTVLHDTSTDSRYIYRAHGNSCQLYFWHLQEPKPTKFPTISNPSSTSSSGSA